MNSRTLACVGSGGRTTLLVGIVLIGAPFALARQKALTKSRIELATEYGNFLLQDISIEQTNTSVAASGTITNNTDRGWRDVSLTLQFLGKSGDLLAAEQGVSQVIEIHDLGKGETKRISGQISWQIIYRPFRKPEGRIADFNVAYDKSDSQFAEEYVFSLIKPNQNQDLVFEDDSVRVSFAVTDRQIGLTVQNRTDSPITVNWDQVSYIDLASQSHRIIHAGTKLTDRDKPQAPTIVPPTAHMEDLIYPADYVEWNGSDWDEKPMLPPPQQADNYKGKDFSVFMPLQVNGQEKDYLFTIEIVGGRVD